MKVVLKYLRLTMYLENEEIGETAMVGEYVIDRTLAIPLCDFKILLLFCTQKSPRKYLKDFSLYLDH